MNELSDAIAAVERLQKTLVVYTDEESIVTALEAQFSTRNVEVARRPTPPDTDAGFVVIRDAAGKFRGALGIDRLEAILSPETHPPWTIGGTGAPDPTVFDFLENTIFTSYDRRQLLAATREIEGRAWRVDAGTLYAGFQDAASFAAQLSAYDRLASERAVDVRVFIADAWEGDAADAIEISSEVGTELSRFWSVAFDGGSNALQACGLVAEERTADRYYGFWTYDPGRVDALTTYFEGLRERA